MNAIAKYSSFISNEIDELDIPQDPKNLYEPFRYLLSLKGKRIRPVLTLLSAELFGGSKESAKHAALAIELFHNFTLVHDDIMDAAPLRRGQETVHKKWNTNIAILAGDILMVRAYEQLNMLRNEHIPDALRIFNKTAIEVCEGQQMDMDFEDEETITEKEYVAMIRLKTSVLIGCALELGAIICDASEVNRKNIYEFGVNIGIAFQIQDDILDLYGDPMKVGKQQGGDILANKNTILSVIAHNVANKEQLLELKSLRNEPDQSSKIKRTQAVFDQLRVKEKCSVLMKHYHNEAINCYNSLIIKNKTDDLLRLMEGLLNREF